MILVHHGGGESGHYFTTEVAQVWHQMPQIILQFPYSGVNFHDGLDFERVHGNATLGNDEPEEAPSSDTEIRT
jgi:hypothetical protein